MKRLVILGAGESGCGAAVLAKQKGYDVFVSDMGKIKPEYKALLEKYNIAYEEGKHTEELIINADEIVKSPGIPNNAPILQSYRELCERSHSEADSRQSECTKIISEIEFAARYTDAKMICITGSNGKTTTTSLIYDILLRAGYNVGLAGNIGQSFALQVATTKRDYYVIELSSFQLDNMYHFRAAVAVLMNITPDHLDRYDYCFHNYADAKMRITRNQTAQDCFIYWADDRVIEEELTRTATQATLMPFTLSTPLPVADSEIYIQGKHNRLNATAATLAARAVGVRDEVIAWSLLHFKGVEHRLQYVATVDGVRYVNDSKATNVDSCYYALDAMTTPVVLILGGKDKGNDYSQIDRLVRQKCHTIVYMGLNNDPLHKHFDSMGLQIIDTHNLQDAMKAARSAARAGDTVLLSPCCASFDLFSSYEDRGNKFMEAVFQI